MRKEGQRLMRIHIIRHAESVANSETVIAGHLEYPLTEKGKRDAQMIAERYAARYSPSAIYCSPLLRARQTASPFEKALNIPVKAEPRLIERHLGIFQGMTYEEAFPKLNQISDRKERWTWSPGGGESYQQIARRLHSFFSSLPSDAPDCLLVSHGGAMRIMRGLLEGTLPEHSERIPSNGEVWEIDFQSVGVKHTIRSIFFEDLIYSDHGE